MHPFPHDSQALRFFPSIKTTHLYKPKRSSWMRKNNRPARKRKKARQ